MRFQAVEMSRSSANGGCAASGKGKILGTASASVRQCAEVHHPRIDGLAGIGAR